jgi:hypothetical protein
MTLQHSNQQGGLSIRSPSPVQLEDKSPFASPAAAAQPRLQSSSAVPLKSVQQAQHAAQQQPRQSPKKRQSRQQQQAQAQQQQQQQAQAKRGALHPAFVAADSQLPIHDFGSGIGPQPCLRPPFSLF